MSPTALSTVAERLAAPTAAVKEVNPAAVAVAVTLTGTL